MYRTTSLAFLGLVVCLGVWLCTQFPAPVAAQERVRARLGIEVRSGERSALAKGTETVKAGDSLRVYVVPEDSDAYVYVVNNDGKTAKLLNAQQAHTKVRKGSPLMLPTDEPYYEIDGSSSKES